MAVARARVGKRRRRAWSVLWFAHECCLVEGMSGSIDMALVVSQWTESGPAGLVQIRTSVQGQGWPVVSTEVIFGSQFKICIRLKKWTRR